MEGLVAVRVEEGDLNFAAVINQLESGAGAEEISDIPISVVIAGHEGAGPVWADLEGAIIGDGDVGPVDAAAVEMNLVSEKSLTKDGRIVIGVQHEESLSVKGVAGRGAAFRFSLQMDES